MVIKRCNRQDPPSTIGSRLEPDRDSPHRDHDQHGLVRRLGRSESEPESRGHHVVDGGKRLVSEV
eukprot:2120433-Rhodomonas_salina.2